MPPEDRFGDRDRRRVRMSVARVAMVADPAAFGPACDPVYRRGNTRRPLLRAVPKSSGCAIVAGAGGHRTLDQPLRESARARGSVDVAGVSPITRRYVGVTTSRRHSAIASSRRIFASEPFSAEQTCGRTDGPGQHSQSNQRVASALSSFADLVGGAPGGVSAVQQPRVLVFVEPRRR